ncbi:MAG: substrate-binding domain-containing protein [bacterium]
MLNKLLRGVLAAVILVCGCERTGTGWKKSATPHGVVAVSLLTLNNPHFRQIGESITQEGRRLGYEVRVLSGDFDVAKQSTQVRSMIAEKVNAIVLSPCDSVAIGPVVREANVAGIPVFTADIACLAPDAKIVTHVGTDNYGGGKQAAHAMIEALGEKGGRVAIIDHKLIESCVLRVKGFKEIIAKYNADRTAGRIEIVDERPGGAAYDGGIQAAETLLLAHAEFDGIFAVNDPSALGARGVLEKAGRADRTVWVGFDGSPEGKAAVRMGKLYATPIQYPDQIGVETMRAVVRHFKGEALPTEMLIPTSLYRRSDSGKRLAHIE